MAAPTTAAGVKKTLANPEPSTHGPSRQLVLRCSDRRDPESVDGRNLTNLREINRPDKATSPLPS
jgi:hypothetical protein